MYNKEDILREFKAFLSREDVLKNTCQLLFDCVKHFNWVGFYKMNNDKNVLKLGPYVGASTDHTEIPYGRGICGQVAISGKTFIVPDVEQEDNYLSCSIETKAEIVIPIYHQNQLIGQLDIDSHYINPFTKKDHELLNEICSKLGPAVNNFIH